MVNGKLLLAEHWLGLLNEPANPSALLLAGKLCLTTNDAAHATDRFARALDNCGGADSEAALRCDALIGLGIAHGLIPGNETYAENDLLAALDLALLTVSRVLIHIQLGMLYEAGRDYDAAVCAYRDAITLDPDSE